MMTYYVQPTWKIPVIHGRNKVIKLAFQIKTALSKVTFSHPLIFMNGKAEGVLNG